MKELPVNPSTDSISDLVGQPIAATVKALEAAIIQKRRCLARDGTWRDESPQRHGRKLTAAINLIHFVRGDWHKLRFSDKETCQGLLYNCVERALGLCPPLSVTEAKDQGALLKECREIISAAQTIDLN